MRRTNSDCPQQRRSSQRCLTRCLIQSSLSFIVFRYRSKGEGGISYFISSWYFSGMLVSLSGIVPEPCSQCWDCIQIKLIRVHKGLRQHPHTLLFIYFLYLCLHFSAPLACHSWRLDRHVCGDVHDRNLLFSSRFTLDTGNATLLMATRPHPGKPSRAEWETGWRSCWISSRMSICPSGERQVSFKTVCTL